MATPGAGRTVQPATLQMGVDAQGNAALAVAAGKPPPNYVQVATRSAGQPWSAVQEIGNTGNSTSLPAFAMDPAGNAIVVWPDAGGAPDCPGGGAGVFCLQIWTKPAGSQTWAAENTLTFGSAFIEPAVALDPSGNGQAMVIWRATPSAGVNVVRGIRGQIGGSWPTAAAFESVENPTDTGPTPSQLHVAIDSAGTAVALWRRTGFNVRAAARASNGTWTQQSLDSTTIRAFDQLFLTTDRRGAVTGAWTGTNGAGTQTIAVTASRDPGAGTWSVPIPLATAGFNDQLWAPELAIAPDGEAVATWGRRVNATGVRSVETAVRSGGSWGPIQVLDPNSGVDSGPALAMDAAGATTAVWANSITPETRFALHPHGGGWGAAQTLDGPAAAAPLAAADSAGHVIAGWPASNTAIATRVWDPVGPSVGALPQLAPTVGAPANFAVVADDVWSKPVAVHWDFGDGSGADGAAVSHTYGQTGSFLVTATATDAIGNASSASQAYTVSAIPRPPLPRPVAGKTANANPVSPIVLVRAPKGRTFVPLTEPGQITVGTTIDTTKGVVEITIDNGQGGLDTARFWGGVFQFLQPKVKKGKKRFAVMVLKGGSFKGCPKAPKAILSKAKRSNKAIRHLWADGKGAFRTVGRYSSATIRGTKWLTEDFCAATRTRVTKGKVGIRDFVRRKVIVLKAPKKYLAKAKRR